MSKAEMRRALDRSIETLSRRCVATIDADERATLQKSMRALNRQLALVNRAERLGAAAALSAATEQLEQAVAAARKGPFDGYLTALEQHLRELNVLAGEALSAGPPSRALLAAAPPRMRAARGVKRARATASRAATTRAPVTDYASLKDEYQRLYDTMRVRPEQQGAVAFYVKMLRRNEALYAAVGRELGNAPWAFIGALHALECSFRLDQHLHNGDPLTARTTHVPKGRPLTGTPPFTWRESALDALKLKRLDRETDWSIPRMLYLFESYNGFGYRRFGINSPYLWSMSNHFEKGKFVADGRFDPNATSKQCGAVLMLKAVLPP